jgi:hypothetical protein
MTKDMNSLYNNNIWTDNLELFKVKYIKFTGMRQRGRPRKGWRKKSRKRSSSAGSEKKKRAGDR